MAQKIQNLQELLDRLDAAADDKQLVSFESILQSVGRRSFAPLLLLAGVILTSPLSGMPGMATTMGTLVLLVAGQMVFRRKSFWLPRWILKRTIEPSRVHKATRLLRGPSRRVDLLLRPRFPLFIEGPSTYVISVVCAVIAMGMPLMEIIPFSASTAGLALAAFGLALLSGDGLLALIALVITGCTIVLIVSHLL